MTKYEFLADLGRKYDSIIAKFGLSDNFGDLVEQFDDENPYINSCTVLNDDAAIQDKFTKNFAPFFTGLYLYEKEKLLIFDWKNSVGDVFGILLGRFPDLEVKEQEGTYDFNGGSYNKREKVEGLNVFLETIKINNYLSENFQIKLVEYDTQSDSYGYYVVDSGVEFSEVEKKPLNIGS